ncbi:hypothetical protein [Pedobacter sp. GR22-6]|uniref:hypothetical protein n=1 Tax=Pedobacter sp. GR22-6 TaxID=3127957 RepID=UPI00307EDC6B
MTEAIFGLVGVLIGAGLTWYQSYWMSKKESERAARYLAIRIVCILDQFMELCAEVVREDGLHFGQPDPEGFRVPKVQAPDAPRYPDDVDWKSIDHELMYKILAFPSEVNGSARLISDLWDISQGVNYLHWYSERAFWFSSYGLQAFKLSKELAARYGIQQKSYPGWDPEKEFSEKNARFSVERTQRLVSYHSALRGFYNR